jgi:hypothetical protein
MEMAKAVLSPALLAAFITMQPSEQAHSLDVLKKLKVQGEDHPDLLAAALLHDLGKTVKPLRVWERVLIVLVKGLSPSLARSLGLTFHWPMFRVAELHPEWGAELAANAGASPLTVALIRRHQETLPEQGETSETSEDLLLRKLQAVDDES